MSLISSSTAVTETITVTANSEYVYSFDLPARYTHINLTISVADTEPNGTSFISTMYFVDLVSSSKPLGTFNNEPGAAVIGEVVPGETVWIYLMSKVCDTDDLVEVQSLRLIGIGNEPVEVKIDRVKTEFTGESDCTPYGGENNEDDTTFWDKYGSVAFVVGFMAISIVIMVLGTAKKTDVK